MSQFKTIIIRLLANFVYTVRYQSLTDAKVKWVVCSGSVGKTIMRRSLFQTLSSLTSTRFITLNSDYCNEIGVLCTLLDIQNFSVYSWKSWQDIFSKQPIENSYVLIELGADFRLDIDWFLKRWSPTIVILTMGTNYHWTEEIDKVLASRLRLCQSILPNGKIYVSELDSVHLDLLLAKNINFNTIKHKQDIYSYPQVVLTDWCKQAGWEQQALLPFKKNRFDVIELDGVTIIKDTYKVTPVCFGYFIKQVIDAKGDTKILIITEIRPLSVNVADLYKKFLVDLRFFNKIYFYGDKNVYDFLSNNLDNIVWLDKETLGASLSDINSELNMRCVLGIKTSAFYKELGDFFV